MDDVLNLLAKAEEDLSRSSSGSLPPLTSNSKTANPISANYDEREQALYDSYIPDANDGKDEVLGLLGKAEGELAVEARRQQRAMAEQAPPEEVKLVKDLFSASRRDALGIIRSMTPEQKKRVLELAPGVAQQLGDDRGGFVSRTASAIGSGVASVSQAAMEFVGAGGTEEEVAFIDQLKAAASPEMSAARPGDEWYEKGFFGAAEMAPPMLTYVAGGGAGQGLARVGGQLLARGAAAGVPGAKAAFQAVGAAGKFPTKLGMKGATTKGAMDAIGSTAGVTAASFPQQYIQETKQLKELGMEDGVQRRLLAAGTAAISGLWESIVPNPLKVGKVSFTDGIAQAARQYLWESVKRAPGELSEEYLQGVTSGLGKTLAGWIDENVKDKSIAEAFSQGWEQMKEAALPLGFLLGVPGAGGAIFAARRAAIETQRKKLQEIISKGFVSKEDAKEVGVEGANRAERLVNTKEMDNQLKAEADEIDAEIMSQENAGLQEQPVDGGSPVSPSGVQPPPLPGSPPAISGGPPQLPGTPPVIPSEPPPLPGRAQQQVSPTQAPVTPGTPSEASVATPEAQQQSNVPSGQAPAPEEAPKGVRWSDYGNDQYGMEIDNEDGKASATLSFDSEGGSRIYVDLIAKSDGAAKGSGKKLLESIVENSSPYSPSSIEGHFTNAPALGAFGSAFGKENVTFRNRQTGEPESVTFDQAMEDPARFVASASLVKSDPLEVPSSNVQGESVSAPPQAQASQVAPPRESSVRVKDEFGKDIPPKLVDYRREFESKAMPGAEFTHTGYKGSSFRVMPDGKLLEVTTGRMMGDVASMANSVKPGNIKWSSLGEAVSSPQPLAQPSAQATPVSQSATQPLPASQQAGQSTPAPRPVATPIQSQPSAAPATAVPSSVVQEQEATPRSKSPGDVPGESQSEEVQDVPKTKRGGDPDEVQTKGRQGQANAEAQAEGQVSSKENEGQAAKGTSSSGSSSKPSKGETAKARRKERAKRILAKTEDSKLQSTAKRLGLKSTDRDAIIDELSDNPKFMDYLESIAPKAKPSKKKRSKSASSDRIPAQLGNATLVQPKDLTDSERKQVEILSSMGVELRFIEGGNENQPGLFAPKLMTIWINRGYTQAWNETRVMEGRSPESMTWGLFAHEAFHAIRVKNPEAWARLYDWVSNSKDYSGELKSAEREYIADWEAAFDRSLRSDIKKSKSSFRIKDGASVQESFEGAIAAGVELSEATRSAAYYIRNFNENKNVREDEALSRFLEDRAGDFSFWSELGRSEPGLLAKIGRWLRRVLRFAEPDTLAGQVRLAIESAMNSQLGEDSIGVRAAVGQSDFSPSQIDVEEVRAKDRPGKRVSKGLSMKTVKGKKVFDETEDLSLEYVKRNEPKIFIKNANVIASYHIVAGKKKFKKATNVDQAQEIYDVFIRETADNLNYLYSEYKPEFRELSTLWYDGANAIANEMAVKYKATPEQVAGIIAAMSPQKDWYQNVRCAELLLQAFDTNPVFTREMVDYQRDVVRVDGLVEYERDVRRKEKAVKKSRTNANKAALQEAKDDLTEAVSKADALVSMLENYIGKNLKDTPEDVQPYVVRLYHEISTTKDYNVIAPDGSVIGVAKNVSGENALLAWGSYGEIGKAVSIRNNGSPENITRKLGVMHKIRNFYNNIIDPMSSDGDVTMDTHAIAAALLMPLSSKSPQVSQNFGSGGVSNSGPFGIKGLYYAFAEAYNLSAKENGLLPRQIQSATWDPVRGLFTDVFKSYKKNVEKIDDIWKEYRDGKATIDETRQRVFQEAGGISDPTWARPVYSEPGEGVRKKSVRRRGGRARWSDVGASSGQERASVRRQRPESTRDGRGRPEGRKIAPLEGAPSVPGLHGPDPRIVSVAERYAEENGIDLKRQAEYVQVDEDRAKRIAAAYEQMVHAPQDPEVKEAYRELIKQTTAQYKSLVDAGYKFWFTDLNNPANVEYLSSPFNALRDLRDNQQMGVFPTDVGFGSSDLDVNDNPLLAETGFMWPVGGVDGELKPVLANDLFRAVHDAFGHSLEGAGFRARGEENAWQAHVRLFTGKAVGAITSETRGQNSWLNFGPHGEKNRTAKTEDTVFADQKTGLMPEWTWTEGRAADYSEETNREIDNDEAERSGSRASVGRGDRGDEGLREDPGQDRQVPGGNRSGSTPAYGKPRDGAVSYVGRHYSQEPRESLDSRKYGTGVSRFSGAESRRLRDSSDNRIKQRVYFYIDTAGEIKPEAGVGKFAHEVKLENLYDPESGLIPRNGDHNDFESAVIDAGFDGYIAKSYGMAVLLGPQHTNVPVRRATEYEGERAGVGRRAKGDLDANELGSGVRFAIAKPELAKKLDAGEKVTLYRAMALIDDKLYPPMSASVIDERGRKVLRKAEPVGEWMVAEERPDMVPSDGPNAGKFPLKKPGGGTTWAAYAPYFHASPIPLNDQFTAAWKSDGSERPQLVTVEVEVPADEMEGGYQAKGSTKKTGYNKWNSGVVASKIPGGREVALSRYLKIKRIVPDSEVAKKIADLVLPNRLSIPENTVTPQLRAELEKVGVRIAPEGTKGDDIRYAARRRRDVLDGFIKYLEDIGEIEPMETTGTKHAKTDELRSKRNFPERVPPFMESFQEWEDDARRKYPDAASRLKVIERAERNPARVGKVENAAIGQHIVDLENRREAGEDVLEELLRTVRVATLVGTEAGRALVSRKAERYGDYSLAGLINEHLSIVGKEPTEKQMREYAELADKIKKLEKEKADLAEKLAKETIARKRAEAKAKEKADASQDKAGTKKATIAKKIADGFAAFRNAWSGDDSGLAAVGRRRGSRVDVYGFGFGTEDLPDPSTVSRDEWLKAYMPYIMRGAPSAEISQDDMVVLGKAFGSKDPFDPQGPLMKMLGRWAYQSDLHEANWYDGVRVLFEDSSPATQMMLEQISKESGVELDQDAFSDPADYRPLAKAFSKYLEKHLERKPSIDVFNLFETSKALLDPLEYAINAWEDAQGSGSLGLASVGRQTESAEFKKWFGDSKVVDSEGNPLVMYHGTDKDFNVFENRGGKVTVLLSTFDVDRKGFFFAKDKDLALEYGSKLVPVYLSIQNPADFLSSKEWPKIRDALVERGWNGRYLDRKDAWELFDVDEENDGEKLIKDLKSMGYDGAIIEEPSWKDEDGKYGVAHVAFDNTQIKSATKNVGTFDPSNPDIRYAAPRQNKSVKQAARNIVDALREAGVSSYLELEAQVKANMPDVTAEQMQSISEAWEESVKKTKAESPLGDNPGNPEIGARAKELMRIAIEAGYGATEETWMEVVDAVHSQMSIEVPGIAKYDTMQAMSDYGAWRPLSKDEIDVKTRAIRGKARQSLKIEDLLKAIAQSDEWLKSGMDPEEVARRLRDQGRLPKATGREQATPDSIERELIAQVNQLKRDLPVSAESREGQLKSALSTAKTSVRNRLEILDKDIELLEEAIANGQAIERPVGEKTRLKPDEELARLRADLELKRRTRDSLKREYERIFPPTKKQRMATADQQIDRAMKSIEELKRKLADVKSGKSIEPNQKQDLVPNEIRAQIKMWQERLRAAKQAAAEAETARYEGEGGAARPVSGRKKPTDRQRLKASEKMLREQIDLVRGEIRSLENGTWKPAAKTEVPTSEIKKALQEELSSLKAMRKKLRSADPAYQAMEEAKYWERYRNSQERRLAFWENRRREAEAGRLPEPLKKRTIVENDILEKNLEIEKAQYEAMYAIEKANRATWNAGQWIGQGLLEITSLIPKSLSLGLELSFIRRQGFFYGYSQPINAIKAVIESIPAVFSQRLALAAMESIENRPNASEYQTAGIDFTQSHGPRAKLEEMYQSALIQWLEGTESKFLLPLRAWGKLYAMFERGNRTFANIMKADLYDIQKRDTLAAREFFGRSTEWTENDIKQAGRTSNIFSGRGTGIRGNNPWMDFLFLARRWAWSRIQADFVVPFQLATPSWIGQWNADRGMRVALAKLYLQTLLGHATKLAMAYVAYSVLAGDDEEKKPTLEMDLRSSDAWALKVGETRLKDDGGLMPIFVLAARIATGTTKTAKGEIKSIYGEDVQYGGKTAADFLISYGRYKLGTGPSAILEFIGGKDAVGNNVTRSEIVTSRVVPLTWKEIIAAEDELGVAQGTLAALEAFVGVSVSTYGPRSEYSEGNEEDRKKQFEGDLKKMEWSSQDPAYMDLLTEDQRRQVEERRGDLKGQLISDAFYSPKKQDFKNEEGFAKAVESKNEAMKSIREAGWTFPEVRQILLDHWKRKYGSPYEQKGGVYVIRESVASRLREAKKELGGD